MVRPGHGPPTGTHCPLATDPTGGWGQVELCTGAVQKELNVFFTFKRDFKIFFLGGGITAIKEYKPIVLAP